MTIGILALAAGQSRRFGDDKRGALLADQRSLLETFTATLIETGLPHLVCLRDTDSEWADFLEQRGVPHYACDQATQGMGATLAQGIGQVMAWRGVLIALADMPWVNPQTYRQLAEQIQDGGIVVPTYRGRRGNPVAFSRTHFEELRNLRGDKGARSLLQRHAPHVSELDVPDAYIHIDVDAPSDLQRAPGR